MRTCPVCKVQYDDGGNHWKTVCYDCYKNHQYLKLFGRVHSLTAGRGRYDYYISHPNVTAEEVNEYIRAKGLETGWGATEVNLENLAKVGKIWQNYTNYD